MEEEKMRLKEAESVVEIPGPRLHIHNVARRDLNRNQQGKLSDSSDLHSTQWASNYVTSPNTTLLKDHLSINGSNFNNNITASLQQQQQQQQQEQQRQHRTSYSASSDLLSESSPDDSLGDYEVDAQQSSSSLDVSPQGDEYRCFSHEDLSDTDSLSDDGNLLPPRSSGRGIVNPNYPGFQHLAHHLHSSDTDEADEEADNNNVYNNNNNNNNNNNGDDDSIVDDPEETVESRIDSVNHLDSVENFQKAFYDKPKFNIPIEQEEFVCVVDPIAALLDLEKDLNVQLTDVVPESYEKVVAESENVVPKDSTSSESTTDESQVETLKLIEDVSDENVVYPEDDVDICNPKEDTNVFLSPEKVIVFISQDKGSVTPVPPEEEFISQDKEAVILTQPEEIEAFLEQDSKEAVTLLTPKAVEKCMSENKGVEPVFSTEEIVVLIPSNNKTKVLTSPDREHITTLLPEEKIDTLFPSEIEISDIDSVIKAIDRELEAKTSLENILIAEMSAASIGLPREEVKNIPSVKMADAFLSSAKEELVAEDGKKSVILRDGESKDRCSNGSSLQQGDSNRVTDEQEKFSKEEQTAGEKEKDEDSVVPRKKEKMEINYSMKKNRHSMAIGKGMPDMTLPLNMTGGVVRRREFGPRARDMMLANRRSMPVAREKKRSSPEMLGGFDVYNIETAMPKIDLDAIESHLRAAREEDRRRRNDREEIRRRLAMGSDADEYYGGDRPGRKPSLQARLQSGMNLQICFMNETVSDTESPSSDTEPAASPVKAYMEKSVVPRSLVMAAKSPGVAPPSLKTRPSTSTLTLPLRREPEPLQPMTEADFFARQARLQAEARMALAQAKEMAHMQMEIERQRQKKSPITEMVRSSLEKVGIPFPEDRRRVSRQILTEMNLAQLQVIVNDLHTQIEVLNEGLVKFLMNRDDLHMEQDSMLVDIEDLTRYLGAKEQPLKEQKESPTLPQNNNLLPHSKPKLNRIAGMVKK